MAKYGNVLYGGTTYGETPKLTYSVEPMSINVINFKEIYITWQQPKGTFTRFRVVRNQLGYPETSEDGYIIYELVSPNNSSLEGAIPITDFKDGFDNLTDENYIDIVGNKNIYYRVFLYTSQNIWVKAGEINAVVPKDTNVTERMLNLLPRTLVSDVLSPFGVVPLKTDLVKSDIYKFLDGISFTYEQLLTQTDLIRPNGSSETGTYSTIEAEFYSSGLIPEPNIPTVNQRRLIRDANYLFSTKGTKIGIENYAETLTGFAPTVTISKNLVLSPQDSTFYNSTGNWSTEDATIESSDEQVPDISDYVIDEVYTCKITPSAVGSMGLGFDNPTTDGIPVESDKDYTFRVAVKCPTSGQNVTLNIEFFDKNNLSIGTETGTIAAANSWGLLSVIATTPVGASYCALEIAWDDTDIFYVDQVFVGKGVFLDYDEARAINIYLAPKSVNYIENPSFEVDDSTWTLTNLSFATDTNIAGEGYAGSNSGKFTLTNTTWKLESTSTIPVEPGVYFNCSMYSYSEDIFDMDMYLDVYDDTDTLIETFSSNHMMEGTWMRNYVRGLMNFDTNPSYAKVRFEGTGNIGDVFFLDMIQAEFSFKPTDYFDGSLPEQVGAVWNGTANASSTSLYPRRAIKVLRLAQTLPNWTPINSWWRLSTAAGLEYTNLDV